MLGSIDFQNRGDQPSRFIIVDDASAGLFVAGFQNVSHDSCNSSSSGEDADQLPFVVGNGKFAQRPCAPSHNDHDVTAADVDDFAAHQATPGDNQDIMGQCRSLTLEGMLIEAECRGDSNHGSATTLSPACCCQRQSWAGTGNDHARRVGDTCPQLFRLLQKLVWNVRTGSTHDSDLQRRCLAVLFVHHNPHFSVRRSTP